MKQFSHVSPDHGFSSLVQFTKNIMTIEVADLKPVDFFHQDLLGTLKNIDCPVAASIVLNLADNPNWDVELDDRKVLGLMRGYLVNNKMPELAEYLAEQQMRILGSGMPSLRQQWNEGLCESLIQSATRLGTLNIASNEDVVIKLIRKANPALLNKTKHVKAKQFIETEWPHVYAKARSML